MCLAGALLFVQLALCGFVEVKRLQDIKKAGSQAESGSFLGLESALAGKEVGYPGGPFDPLNLSSYAPYPSRPPLMCSDPAAVLQPLPGLSSLV